MLKLEVMLAQVWIIKKCVDRIILIIVTYKSWIQKMQSLIAC